MNDNEPKASSPARETRQVAVVNSENVATFYANAVNLRVSYNDFRLTFAESLEATAELLKLKELVRVYMSPQHAKTLATILIGQVEEYERRFGPLPPLRTQDEIKIEDDPISATEPSQPS